jgi:uncharacterized protein YbbC (DUF1343 family)
VYALHATYHEAQAQGDTTFISRPAHLNRLAGSDRLASLLRQGVAADSIVATWSNAVQAFRNQRSSYLLY